VIKVIHGDDGKLDKDVIVGGQTCWTLIVNEARSLKGTGINVVDLIRLKLGNGDSSSFWEDKWYFWWLESEGDYPVASIRKLIDEKRFQEAGISTRWVKSVPSKVLHCHIIFMYNRFFILKPQIAMFLIDRVAIMISTWVLRIKPFKCTFSRSRDPEYQILEGFYSLRNDQNSAFESNISCKKQ
nr:RNA-directed DNA polymerase, eukaryota, reverse transcriptase zinc-binding domain protein [Tanacetum cinerariifolium]